MASEYSVNIKLNTQQVKKDLKTIGEGINNLNRKQSKGSKSVLSDAEQALKIKNTQLGLENKILRIQNSLGPLSVRNAHHNKVMAQLANAQLKTDKEEFTLAKQSIAMAEKEIQLKKVDLNLTKAISKAERRRILLRGRDTGFSAAEFGPQQPMQGPKFPTGAASALNFDRFTGKLMRGPVGSSRLTPRNFGRRFDFQSAMISGGFPLLFGQGPVTAAAGALGGGIGGMFGQMGGFAGGIAATALVQSINQALTAMSELGKAMGPFTQNSQALTDSLGLQGSAEEARIKLIEESEGKTAAFNASMQLMTTRIGEDGVKNLEKFGETTRLLGSELSIATTQLHALGAAAANAALNFFGLTEKLEASAATRSVADAAARGDTAAQDLVKRRQQIEAMGSRGGEARRKQNLLDILEAEEKIFAIRQNTITQAEVMTGQFNSMVRSLEAEKEEAERLVELREQGLNPSIAKTIAALEKEASLAKDLLDAEIELLLAKQARIGQLGEADQTRLTTLEAQRDKIDEAVEGTTKLVKETNDLNEAAKDTVDAFTQLRDTIAQDIGNGLKDLITGAKSLNEVLSNILANMANQFLNFGIFGNFAGTFKRGSGLLGSIFRAEGGPVKRGGSYIVGERGPEMFTPKASGHITPNHQLGGSTSVVVNVDASNTTAQGDNGQAEMLGKMLAGAVQDELLKQQRPGGILYK